MLDASDNVTKGAQAAKDAVALAQQAPLAVALIIVTLFSAAAIYWLGKRLEKLSNDLSAQVKINQAQAETLAGAAKQIDLIPRIMAFLAVIGDRLQIRGPAAIDHTFDREKK